VADPIARLSPIRFGRAVSNDLTAAERREWWLANGRGAYAAGTIAQTLTRRYHGLLIAPVDPPLGRVLVLAKADARLIMADGGTHPLFSNRWAGGAIEPAGLSALESFELDGMVPVWRFAFDGAVVEERIWLEPDVDTVYVAWRLDADSALSGARLSVALLANGRDHHAESWPPGFVPQIEASGAGLTMTAPNRFVLHVTASGGAIEPRNEWYRHFDLPVERERGLGAVDSHLHIADLELPLPAGEWTGFAAGLGPQEASDLGAALARRQVRDRAAIGRALAADPVFADAPPWVMRLVAATDAFVIARPLPDLPDGQSVIAGYPWFGDWGRDTMIALPGLCLATGRSETARRILETFARFIDRGMLPNVFPCVGGVPEYNTADASLWFIEAWRAYIAASGDEAGLRRNFPVLADIVEWHLKGTRYRIAVDRDDGLIYAGEPGVQLTWMDARVGDWVVTPRIGKPVEINALWYNALIALAMMAERIGAAVAPFAAAAAKARAGFARFLRPDGNGLYDVVDGPDGADPSLRPNQIFAVSLWASPLDKTAQRRVVDGCAASLPTSYGLRSLAPHEPGYRGVCTGSVAERDGAYHQGTVWAWLLGPWALAHYRVHHDAAAAQRFLRPIGDHLYDAGLGQVSEIFDGDPPHLPRGCPAQAWSVATILDAWRRLEQAKSASSPQQLFTGC
jgi:predicted glycogen debranching enzyme